MRKILIIISMALILILPVFYMSIDEKYTGDEVVTISMANNEQAGFVFSEGRISNYLKNAVFTSDGNLVKNLIGMATDVLKNKGGAAILNYPRDPEVKLYSSDEVYGWFAKTEQERFNIGSTWLHSLSDDGNSWLYYSLVNISSSVFLVLSATKWAGFIVNMLFYCGMLLVLFKIGKKLGNSDFQNMLTLLVFGCSCDFLTSRTCEPIQ